MNPGIVTRINAFFTACYKLLGFAVLGAILIALASYLGVHSFFYTSESWIAPIIISSSDEEVIRLYGHAAEQQMERDRALANARELRIRLSALERTIQSERRFQERFLDAVESDRRMRASELRRLREILETSREVRDQVELSSKAYAGMARKRANELMSARLVDREEYLTLEHQLAQMARTRLSLAEAEAGIAGRISEIQARARALDDFVKGAGRGKASVDVVLIEREYLESALALARAEEEIEAVRANLEATMRSVEMYEEILRSIRNAPRIRAIEGKLTVAFVPYENLRNAQPNAPVYGCSMGIVFCREVGRIAARLEGEVTARHPVRNKIVRGILVEVDFDDPHWAEEEVLHVGGRPLFL